MDYSLWLIIGGSGAIAFYLAWSIGANDVANSMATAVGSKAITFKQAVVIAGVLNFIGAVFVGPHVAETIKGKISKLTLINCAGNNYNSFAHKADVDNWSQVIDVNLTGTFNVIRTVLPIMREEGYGRIINFSSIVAQMGIPGTSAYAASKAGLWGLSKSIAVENAAKGITINNLNLGYFDIGMIKEVPEKFQEIIKEKIPTRNFGNPENIFNAVKFLMETDYINGTSIDINAGLF